MKDIKGYEGIYAITSCGKVWSYRSKIFLTPRLSRPKHGYYQVNLKYNGTVKRCYIHRLVAETYIDNVNNYNSIDHIDGNTLNNSINNLKWMPLHDNVSKSQSQKVLQYDLDGNFINEWPSVAEAEKFLNKKHSSISKCCRGEQKQAYGYKWAYKN